MGFAILFEALIFTVKLIDDRFTDRKKNTIKALGAVTKAFQYTYDYLRNNDGEYVPNMELADLWNKASAKVMHIDKLLGQQLADKSKFWMDPNIYIELNRQGEVLTLNQVNDLIGRFKMKI